jgi:arsenical pump membrane protein
MIPVAAVGLVVAFVALCGVFRKEIDDHIPGRGPEAPPLPRMSAAEWQALAVLAGVLGAYPIVSAAGGPVWVVATIGALLGALVCARHRIATPRALGGMVAWDILLFLFAVFVMARGLQRAGVVGALADVYAAPDGSLAQLGLVGTVSAGGSALLNNHPMALLNALALDDVAGADRRHVLAALVGGDLGPRLLPMGSLAGLLWMKTLARLNVPITVKQFVVVGAVVTLPALVASLAVLFAVA